MLSLECAKRGETCQHCTYEQHLKLHRTRGLRSRHTHQGLMRRQAQQPDLTVRFASPIISLIPHAQHHFTGSLSGMAADSLGAIRRSSGVNMLQLHKGARHLNPFTQIVWTRGRRRWMGLRAGRWVAVEQPAAWLLDLQQWCYSIQQRWHQGFLQLQQSMMQMPCSVQHAMQQLHYLPMSPVLLVGALVLAALLVSALVKRRQRHQQPAEVPVDAKVSARKAASLAEQRSRFRRALGEDEEPTTEMASSPAVAPNTSSDIVTDQGAGKGQDNFDAWDEDTQKQWQKFLKGSRSQEIDVEQWWDIKREELPADRHVYQDFNR